MTTQEKPPPYNGDVDTWVEETIDYLIRLLADLNRELEDLDARVTALEP